MLGRDVKVAIAQGQNEITRFAQATEQAEGATKKRPLKRAGFRAPRAGQFDILASQIAATFEQDDAVSPLLL